MSTAILIERLDGGLLELDGWGLASTFFTIDPSSVGMGSYDSLCGRTRRDQIEIADVEALNRTMRARTAHERWAPLIDTPLPWLQALDPAIDLLETADERWAQADAEHAVLAALAAAVGPGRGVSVATKMLHLKRPRLFPILDRLVVEMLGGTLAEDAAPEVRAQLAANLMLHVRTQGIRNLDPLRKIQSQLARLDLERSLVRILDAILWLAHPAAGNTGAKRVLACRMEDVAPPTEGS
jgi:Family of unknown function (DUF6308)